MPNTTADGCIPIEEFEALAENPQDARHAHLRDCPRCRALLASYGRFVDGMPELADVEAEAELSARLAAAIGPTPEPAASEPGSLRRLWAGAWLRPALGGAALLLAVLLLLPPAEMDPSDPAGRLREQGGEVLGFQLEAIDLGDGSYRLSWHGIAGADGYRVQLFAADLSPIATRHAGRDTSLVIDEAAAFWQVEALRGEDLLRTSSPAQLPQR